MMLQAYAQSFTRDSILFKPKPLQIDEIDLVSSYYSQNDDPSAITGGIGTERVVDLSNGLDIKRV
jgi:hypothetical protein